MKPRPSPFVIRSATPMSGPTQSEPAVKKGPFVVLSRPISESQRSTSQPYEPSRGPSNASSAAPTQEKGRSQEVVQPPSAQPIIGPTSTLGVVFQLVNPDRVHVDVIFKEVLDSRFELPQGLRVWLEADLTCRLVREGCITASGYAAGSVDGEYPYPYTSFSISVAYYTKNLARFTRFVDSSKTGRVRVLSQSLIPNALLGWALPRVLRGEQLGKREDGSLDPTHLDPNTPNINELKPHQVEGIEFALQRQGRCIFADAPGLGKTVQALLTSYQYSMDFPLFITVPPLLLDNWKSEVFRWCNTAAMRSLAILDHMDRLERNRRRKRVPLLYEHPSDYSLHNNGSENSIIYALDYADIMEKGPYHSLFVEGITTNFEGGLLDRRRLVVVLTITQLGKLHTDGLVPDRCCFIVDESHEYKDPSAKRTKDLMKILSRASRVLLCSATPIFGCVRDMYTQLSLVGMPLPYSTYSKRYCDERRVTLEASRSIVVANGFTARREFLYLVRTLTIHRRHDGLLLPLTRYLVTIPSTPDAPSEASLGTLQCYSATAKQKGELCGPHLVNFYTRFKLPFVVFYHHKAISESLLPLFVGAGIPTKHLDGGITTPARISILTDFQNGKLDVLLCSIETASVGISLVRANVCFFIEISWTPAALQQAEGRIRRISSQHRQVFSFILDTAQGIDQHIRSIVNRKSEVSSEVLGDAPIRWTEITRISVAQLLDLPLNRRELD
ncbi:putative SNF2 family helicase [Giardia muris]|uniref:Putative SNF2 family helicase n=1 Tax=Giardia muris TaxID=5742 RepID=A0A4Z1T467_GIAMU|nr:putative SNF2 family helicase [Giardia muris]|eukprot:TNJ27329.1 putative SNF2 family helicase [Giardia muris]